MPLPETEQPGRLQAELISRGLRMTPPAPHDPERCGNRQQHLDASQLLRRARKIDPGIDRVTVYRTLKLLKRHGLIDELDLMHLQGRSIFTSADRSAIICTWHACVAGKSWSSRAIFSTVSKGKSSASAVPYFGYTYGDRRLLLSLPPACLRELQLVATASHKKAANTLTVAVPVIRMFTALSNANSVANKCA